MRRQTKVFAVLAAFALLGAARGDDDDGDEAGGDASGRAAPLHPPTSPTPRHHGRRPGLRRVADPDRDLRRGAGTPATRPGPRIWGGFRASGVQRARVGRDQPGSRLRGLHEFLNDGAGQATSDVTETLDLLTPLLEERDLVGGNFSDVRSTPTGCS